MMRLNKKTAALMGVAAIYAADLPAQTAAPTQSAAPTTGPTSTPTSSSSTSSAPIGATVLPYNASVPQPNPSLAYNSALPDRRGYWRAEPFSIYPFVGMGFGTNSNLAGTSNNAISSPFWVVTPRLDAVLRSRGDVHTLSYTGNFGWYTKSAADDFHETELIGSTEDYFTSRADLKARAYYLDKSDPRGTLARPSSAEPDRWHGVGANGTFGYGANSAQGRIEFDLGATQKRYTNNRDVTINYDLSTINGAGRFFYRLAPRTRALAEINVTDYRYTSVSLYNNTEVRYLLGATWDAAAATSGTIKIGWMTKDFSDPSRKNYSGANFTTNLRWLPLTYSTIDFIATRSAVDSFGIGIYSVDTSIGAIWNHRWREYVSTQALLTRTHSVYQGLDRTDDFTVATLGGYFDPRKWLRLGIQYSRQQRSSTVADIAFSRNVFTFTIGATL